MQIAPKSRDFDAQTLSSPELSGKIGVYPECGKMQSRQFQGMWHKFVDVDNFFIKLVDREAFNAITHEFIVACIDRSIRFCLSWEARLRGAGMIQAVGASGVKQMRKVYMGPLSPDSDEDNEDQDSASDNDDGASEDEEQDFKRFRA